MKKMKNKSKRKSYDWEAIEKDYRAGILSIREIARRHGCHEATIRGRGRRYGWHRDLTEEIRTRTRTRVSRKAPEEVKLTEEEAIEEAVEQQVAVIRRHQGEFIEQWEQIHSLQVNVKNGIEVIMVKDGKEKVVRLELTIQQKATVLNAVSNASARLVPLERQAYNIQDGLEGSEEGKKGGRYTSFPHDDLTIKEWQEQVGNGQEDDPDTDS